MGMCGQPNPVVLWRKSPFFISILSVGVSVKIDVGAMCTESLLLHSEISVTFQLCFTVNQLPPSDSENELCLRKNLTVASSWKDCVQDRTANTAFAISHL